MSTSSISTSFTNDQVVPSDATFDVSNLKGKSVLLTGGASGIGEQLLRAFVKAGAFVTFGDLADEPGKQLAAKLGAQNVAFVHCNVTSWADQLELFKAALEKSPAKTLDIVIANAGVVKPDEVFHHKEEENGDPKEPDLTTVYTNMAGVAYTLKLALFYLPKQPTGAGRDRSIILTGSLASYLDQPGAPLYNASKWGVRGFMRNIRNTGPKENMRINIVAPWYLDTAIMSNGIKDHVRSAGIEFAELEDCTSAYLHFASNTTLNGRAFAIVPRSVDPRGYLDVAKDDEYARDDPLALLQGQVLKTTHRTNPK